MKSSSLALLLLCLASGAQAQVNQGAHVWSLGLGAGLPLNRYYDIKDKVGNPGFSVGGRYLYHVRPSVGVGLDLSYCAGRTKTSSTSDFRYTSAPELLQVLAVGKYSLLADRKFRPYVLGGVGLGRFSFKKTQSPTAGTWADTGTAETRTPMDAASTGLAFTVGSGLDWDVTKKVLVGLDLRWSQTSIARTKFWGDKFQAFHAAVMLGCKIGGKPAPPKP